MSTNARPARGLFSNICANAYLLGALLLVVPDLFLFLLIMPWWKPGLTVVIPLSFFLVDAAVGLLTVFLIRICRQKGVLGDLILVALRAGQMAAVYAVKLSLFAHDTLNLLMFVCVPAFLFAGQALGMKAHVSELLHALDGVGDEASGVSPEK